MTVQFQKVLILMCFFILACSFKAEPGKEDMEYLNRVFKQPSQTSIKGKTCQIRLSVSEMGGFLILLLGENNKTPQYKIEDVTGVGWLTEDIIIYSVGSIYGKPGIYKYNCKTHKIVQLIEAENQNKEYPSGADYFEIRELSAPIKEVQFYYAADVDKVDFKNFRREENIRKIIVQD